jgi:hypothetical protein
MLAFYAGLFFYDLLQFLNFQISQGSVATRLRCDLNIYIYIWVLLEI